MDGNTGMAFILHSHIISIQLFFFLLEHIWVHLFYVDGLPAHHKIPNMEAHPLEELSPLQLSNIAHCGLILVFPFSSGKLVSNHFPTIVIWIIKANESSHQDVLNPSTRKEKSWKNRWWADHI